MRLHEIDRLFDGVGEVVDVTHEQVRLERHLRLPEGVRYRRESLTDATGPGDGADLGADVLVVALAGPNPPAHTAPADLPPLLRRLRPGARLLLLGGWAVESLPAHQLLDPLGEASCQVVAAAPLDRVAVRGVHVALVVERVLAVVPPRPYLITPPAGGADVPAAGTGLDGSQRALLRVANEHLLADLIARPLRRQLGELTGRAESLARELAERDARLRESEQALAESRRRLAELESSPALAAGRRILDAGPAGGPLRRVARRALGLPLPRRRR